MPQKYNFTDKDRKQSREREQRRRDRIRDLPRAFDREDRTMTYTMFGNKCVYCDALEEEVVLEADHYIDIYKEDCPGTVVGNMVPACRKCNRKKNNKGQDWVGKDRRKEIESNLQMLGAYWL